MSEFVLTVSLDNDAFTGDATPELVRILSDVAGKLESWGADNYRNSTGSIVDVNGNRVGGFVVRDAS